MFEEININKLCRDLMTRSPFYGFILCSINKYWSTSADTAYVSPEGIGFKLVMNKEFMEAQSPNGRLGILLHEVLHLAFFHLHQWDRFPNKELANIAADMVVNQYIPKQLLDFTIEPILPSMFSDLNLAPKESLKYYYDKLKEAQDKGDSRFKYVGYVHKWEDLSEETKDLLKKQLEHTLKEARRSCEDSIPQEMKDLLNSLDKPPVFNWKTFFRRFIGCTIDSQIKKSSRKENKRECGEFGIKFKRKCKVLCIVDTSGSISKENLEDFFNELDWQSKYVDIDLVQSDTKITSIHKFKKGDRPLILGRGGTNFSPAIQYYNNNRSKYSSAVFFTDGYGEPHILKPLKYLLWVICEKGQYDKSYYPSPVLIMKP